jgi:NAD(P)-dependent dehydrogenase (short-subunit alcohol dehydrogenase family)
VKDLRGKVAVVTGAASGIGLALSERFAAEGMKVVMADIEAGPLATAAAAVRQKAPGVLDLRVDVSKPDDVERLARETYAAFGAAHVLCNNAGVAVIGAVHEHTLADWQWVIDVNLWGVIHGVRAFLPRMLAGGDEGHIVNTASMGGLMAAGLLTSYVMTKHAVVGLSEALALYLRPRGIGVSCLCPAGVATNIVEQISFYGKPAPPRGPAFPVLDAESVGELVAEGVTQDRFLILTAPEAADELREHGADVDAYLSRLTKDAP